MKQYAVLNVTNNNADQAAIDLNDNVWHLISNATYDKVVVHQKTIPLKIDWDIIGFPERGALSSRFSVRIKKGFMLYVYILS